jgi:hypothetical protein
LCWTARKWRIWTNFLFQRSLQPHWSLILPSLLSEAFCTLRSRDPIKMSGWVWL